VTGGLVIAGLVGVALLVHFVWSAATRSKTDAAHAVHAEVHALGDDLVPASIHPLVDPNRCIGSGACVTACPEHDVIGLLHGRVKLVNPLACIGHGACAAACPVEAISLVFGTARRGVELPAVDEDFQTNQPGVYVVGELGGMGLIRNAIVQGRECAQYIAASDRRAGDSADYDAVVIGAGPAGISATLQLMEEELRVLLLEREEFGGTILHYPRAKVVMTGVLDIPRFGTVKQRTMTKEQLVELWQQIREQTDIPVRTGALVDALARDDDGVWRVFSSDGEVRAANVVLALGRRGSPRKLDVPGENLAKVSYRLIEPAAFEAMRVLVVGGGNAAAECTLALADSGGCPEVALSYRRGELARLRGSVRARLDRAIETGKIVAHLPTEVTEIRPDEVQLRRGDGSTFAVRNDAVIVQVGGTPPAKLLESFGVDTVVKRGER